VDPTRQHEEHILFSRLRTAGSAADREHAVRRYLPLARSLAHRYRYSGEPTEDLEQVASIGLLKAIDRFDPGRGTAFSSFAVPTILGELRRHFRDRTWALRAPRELQELTLRIEAARDAVTSSLGRQPTIAELSQRLEVSAEQILAALELDAAHHPVSLEGADAEDTQTPGRIDDGYARAEERAVLDPLLRTLSRRDAEIVLLRFRDDLTQDDIARRVGVSQMQISRVLSRSLAQLRDATRHGPVERGGMAHGRERVGVKRGG
jgi:RNA polymerase sigma-B factor